MKKVSVILVNYNGIKYNDKCIRSILDSTISKNITLFVVDNASSDDSLTDLKKKWGENRQVKIIELEQNYGFSKANNVGIKKALELGSEYVLLLNNDTEIAEDAIEKMIHAHQKSNAIVVPKIYYADKPDIIWCAGGEIRKLTLQSKQRGLNEVDYGQYESNMECSFANGCCMLLSSESVIKVGFLEEDYFLYHEDTEYSLRARKLGQKIYYCADAIVYHKVNGSSKGNNNSDNAYYMARNWLMCNRQYQGRLFRGFLVYFFLNRMAWFIIWRCQKKSDMIEATMQGIHDFKKGIVGKRGCTKKGI